MVPAPFSVSVQVPSSATPSSVPAKVEIYTWRFCPFCIRAKGLLDRKHVSYSEYAIDNDQVSRAAMVQRANGRTTVPQIFINNRGIGGYDELQELEQQGHLDVLLGLREAE
jgi:glutaredoxin 3